MLILTRRPTEILKIGEGITITVLEIKGRRVRIGVSVPSGVAVRREETLRKIKDGQPTPDANL
jgi:carbon storage regulator